MSGTMGWIYGLESASSGGNTITVASGQARDATDSDWITVPSGSRAPST